MSGEILVRRHPRARRIKLRIDPVTGAAVLTLPPGVSRTEGLRFAERHQAWLEARRATLPAVRPLAPGTEIPFRGHDHLIDHRPDQPGIFHDMAGTRIICGGPVENFETRLDRWLRGQARRHLATRVAHYAEELGRAPKRLRIGDQKSRWGSCSGTGTLSLSWRLVLAPEFVSDYVVAHEVAHLVEMNHSARFWRLVESLVEDHAQARNWLVQNGAALHRVGALRGPGVVDYPS